jgi:hypothetical protein
MFDLRFLVERSKVERSQVYHVCPVSHSLNFDFDVKDVLNVMNLNDL